MMACRIHNTSETKCDLDLNVLYKNTSNEIVMIIEISKTYTKCEK